MNYWFIRLGSDNELHNCRMYRDLAGNHSIIKIGYGITEDVTDKNKNGIAKHCQRSGKAIGLIDSFINKVKVGDIVISPFGNKTTKMRIGRVLSECNTVDSFFKKKEQEYADFFKTHIKSSEFGFIGIKPARKVKWLTEEMEFRHLPSDLQDALANAKNESKIRPIAETIIEVKAMKGKKILSDIEPKFLIS